MKSEDMKDECNTLEEKPQAQDGVSLDWLDPMRDVLLQLPGKKQKDCCVCSERPFGGKRRRAKTMCAKCKRGVHRTCAVMHVCVLKNQHCYQLLRNQPFHFLDPYANSRVQQ